MPIFRSLRLCCSTTILAVSFLICCVLELGCGSARVVSGLPAEAAGAPGADVHVYVPAHKPTLSIRLINAVEYITGVDF